VIALVAGDAVAGAHDAAEFFDIDVEKVAGVFALVTDGRWRRVQIRELGQAVAGEEARDGGP
jgi:hypothetical protein